MNKKEIVKTLKESVIQYKENLKDKNFIIVYMDKNKIKK